ncbi:hypothetical protein BV882_38925 [Streptomyces sp. 46]|nr:hypothetical protein BV882_38925 [Streptomyces sp. 46]
MAAPAPLTLEEIELLEPNYLGPTWQKDAFDRWRLPEFMLGWRIAGWCEVDRIGRQHVETLVRLFEAHRSSRRSTAVELDTPRESAIPRGWQGKPRAPRARTVRAISHPQKEVAPPCPRPTPPPRPGSATRPATSHSPRASRSGSPLGSWPASAQSPQPSSSPVSAPCKRRASSGASVTTPGSSLGRCGDHARRPVPQDRGEPNQATEAWIRPGGRALPTDRTGCAVVRRRHPVRASQRPTGGEAACPALR